MAEEAEKIDAEERAPRWEPGEKREYEVPTTGEKVTIRSVDFVYVGKDGVERRIPT